MFVCHGNICRSPMAEFVMKDFVQKKGLSNQFYISSKGTSDEEIGNSIHYGTRKILMREYIDFDVNKKASQLNKADYDKYDYFIVMDENNFRSIHSIFNDKRNKIYKLLDFVGLERDIKDPWYTGDFDTTYEDIKLGCTKLLEYLIQKYNL